MIVSYLPVSALFCLTVKSSLEMEPFLFSYRTGTNQSQDTVQIQKRKLQPSSRRSSQVFLECPPNPFPQNWQSGLSCSSWVRVARDSLCDVPFLCPSLCLNAPQLHCKYNLPSPYRVCRQPWVDSEWLEIFSSWEASYEIRVLAWTGSEIAAALLTCNYFSWSSKAGDLWRLNVLKLRI